MEINELIVEFNNLYKEDGDRLCFHSPGRVNLIVEHTDYNGGFVFPCALSFGTYAVVRKRDDNIFNFASAGYDLKVSCDIKDMMYNEKHGWVNYLKGLVVEFLDLGYKLSGLDIMIAGNIPTASGLSSSASIEMLMAVILNDIFKCAIDTVSLVKMTLHSENEYIGLKCGIMDQFAIGMGKKDFAMFLDCSSLKFKYVPVNLPNHKLIISNTKKARGLAESKYNERCAECEKAVSMLNKELNIKLLGELSPEIFEEKKTFNN